MSDRGYITAAVGSLRYLEFAVDLALSLRAHDRRPIAVAIDDAVSDAAPARYLSVFDRVARVPPGYRGYLSKLYMGEATPWRRTLFIDADALVEGGHDALWDRLDGLAFALQGEFLDRDRREVHHLRSTRELMRRFGLDRYLKSNSGVFYFEGDRGRDVLGECHRLYLERFKGWRLPGIPVPDEILLGIIGGRRGLDLIPPPLPMPWSFDGVAPADPRYSVFHFIDSPSPALMGWLMDGVRRRRGEAGLPPEASIGHWAAKAKWSRRSMPARALLQRLLR